MFNDGFQCAKENLKFYQCYEKFCHRNGEGCDKAADCASELQFGMDSYSMLGDDTTTGYCKSRWKVDKKGQFSCK